ncbi:MAG: ABC transporter permease [Propionibacteriales bacterium]|nr:ABC transporter permease [Propionibacteriales bacterium]
MLSHVLRIFRSDLPRWLPTIVVVGLMAILIGTCLNQFVWTGSDAFVAAAAAAGLDPGEFGTVSLTLYVLVAVLSVCALTVVGSVTVEHTRTTFAQWRLIGATPRQVRHSLWALVGLASIAGALPGSLISIGVSQAAVPLFNQMAAASFPNGSGSFAPPPFAPSAAAWAGAFVVSVATCSCGALIPSWRAARVDAVDAMREPLPRRRRGRWIRWVVGGFMITFAATMVVGLVAAPRTSGLGVDSAITAGLLTSIGMHVLGPELVPVLITITRGLLSLLPTPLGRLATRSARASAEANANLIAPLAAAIGLGTVLIMVLQSAVAATAAAGDAVNNPNYTDTYVMTGLFGFVAGLTSVAVLTLAGRDAVREQAILRAAGMTPRQVGHLIGWQSLILTLCACTLALVPVIFAGLIVTVRTSLVIGTPVLVVPWVGIGLAALACWGMLWGVQTLQFAPWLRRETADALRRG